MDLSKMKVYDKEVTFDLPILFNELTIYPVETIDYFDFFISINCLLLDKYLDVEAKTNFSIYQMSYLEYLTYQIENHPEKMYITLLTKLLSLSLKKDLFKKENNMKLFKDKKGKPVLSIDGQLFNYRQFDELRDIICYQNDIDLTIYGLDPRVRAELQKTIEFQNKGNKSVMGSLEDQMLCVMISTSLKKEDIYNLSIRKFKKILERADHKMHYEIYEAAKLGGFVEMKEDYPHWLSALSKNVSTNVTSYDKFAKNGNIEIEHSST